MEQIEIYSSKKKSLLGLLGGLIFVILGVYIFLHANDFTGYKTGNPFFNRVFGVICTLFFGYGTIIFLVRLLKNRVLLIINSKGINVNPKKTDIVEWKNIESFSELKIKRQKLIVIHIDNTDYWIAKEKNAIKKQMMKFSLNYSGSPFALSANPMQIDHKSLLNLLKKNLNKHKHISGLEN